MLSRIEVLLLYNYMDICSLLGVFIEDFVGFGIFLGLMEITVVTVLLF